MQVRRFGAAVFLTVLVLGLSGTMGATGASHRERERARAELTESQNRARLHNEREFLPSVLPEEVHSQIERELLDTWHAIRFGLLTCIALLVFFLLPLFTRERL